MRWLIGFGSSAVALGVAGTVAWFGSDGTAMFGGISIMMLCLLFAYLVQWSVFIHAWAKHTEKFYDLTGSATYVVMVIAAVWMSGASDLRSLVIAGVIVIWAARLGPFLFKRIKQAGDDRRFRQAKMSFPTFFMFWTLQGTWVFVTACCALAAITATAKVALDGSFLVGIGLWLGGFVVEVVADNQKSRFRADPANSGQFIQTGLWAWSRHPNYFGEIVLWTGIAVMALPVLSGTQYVTLISPLFVVVLLTFISGVRMLEHRADKLWGDDPDYQAYKQHTPVLMLWIPRRR